VENRGINFIINIYLQLARLLLDYFATFVLFGCRGSNDSEYCIHGKHGSSDGLIYSHLIN